ncbi:MAG: DUF4136 domain-containing protein [Myxococcota bacterium]
MRALVLSALALALACSAAPLKIRSVTDLGASFEGHRRVAYAGPDAPPGGFQRVPLTEDAERIVEDTAIGTLDEAGWEVVPLAQADVILRAGTGRRDFQEAAFQANGTAPVIFESASTYEGEVEDDTLVVDAFERATGRHLWHGQIVGFDESPAALEQLPAAVRRLLGTFPLPGTPASRPLR